MSIRFAGSLSIAGMRGPQGLVTRSRQAASKLGISSTSTLGHYAQAHQSMGQVASTNSEDWETSVGKHLSFASPESDFTASRPSELPQPTTPTAPATHDWLLFPTRVSSFASPESDWCAPTAEDIAVEEPYQQPAFLSWATPFADFVAPTPQAMNEADVMPYQTMLSFASPESDFTAPSPLEIKAADEYVSTLSFASPESDFTAPSALEIEAATDQDLIFSHQLSFTSPESDFTAPSKAEIVAADEFDANFNNRISFAMPESDFTTDYVMESFNRVMSLHEALTPSNEARVLTSADGRFEIQHVNAAWTRLCGFTNQESHGKTLGMLQGEDTDPEALKDLVGRLNQGKSTAAILINYDAQGRKFRNHLTATPVMSESGKITHFLGVLRDVGGAEDEALATQQAVLP